MKKYGSYLDFGITIVKTTQGAKKGVPIISKVNVFERKDSAEQILQSFIKISQFPSADIN